MLQERATIERLANLGEPLAMRVYATYKTWFHTRNSSDRRMARRNEDAYRKTINEFIARSLMIFDRAHLRAKYGVYQDDPESIYDDQGRAV